MALFIPGSLCPLCGRPMGSAGEVVMFSSFVADQSDPLFVLSDAAVHTACFAGHPLSEEASRWHDEAARNRKASDRICAVCRKPLLDPDDYFGTGLLTRDAASPLFEFNFVHLHRSHAMSWERFDEFRRRMEEVQSSGSWQGAKLVFGASLAESVRWVVGHRPRGAR